MGGQTLDVIDEVRRYSPRELEWLVCQYSGADKTVIRDKTHAGYLVEYFKDIGIGTIVAERPYTDKSYIEDHAKYLLRCFRDIPKTCARLHFFADIPGVTLDRKYINDIISQGIAQQASQYQALQDAYRGFMVIRPLARTIIGNTCLAVRTPTAGTCHIPVTRDYKVNLSGIPLSVKSLAFQEQDTILSACATSALWSSFHATGKLFQHEIPSPSAITERAASRSAQGVRLFPNRGLSTEEVACAIQSIGLEAERINCREPYFLKMAVRAYLSLGIPPILVGKLVPANGHALPRDGFHAVAVTGYGCGTEPPPLPAKGRGQRQHIPFVADGIDQLFVHDDQVGPFADMTFATDPHNEGRLKTQWLDKAVSAQGAGSGPVFFEPLYLLAPLYHKIRIPLTAIHPYVSGLHAALKERQVQKALGQSPLWWDLRLTTSNEMKTELIKAAQRCDDALAFLRRPCPRFLWRATLYLDGCPAWDTLFDATDIEQTNSMFASICHDDRVQRPANTLNEALNATPRQRRRQATAS